MQFKVSSIIKGAEFTDVGTVNMINSFEGSTEWSEEGFLKDAADQNWLGPIGLITALFQRNHHLIGYLTRALIEVKHSLPDLDPDVFIDDGEYTIIGNKKIKKRINLASKYLPNYNQFKPAVEALEKMTQYLTTVNPEQYSLEKAVSFLKGTIFTKSAKTVSQKDSIKYAALTLTNMIPYGFASVKLFTNTLAGKATAAIGSSVAGKISTVIWFYGMADEAVDIRSRGWDSVEKLKEGYALTERLLKVINTANNYLRQYKSFTDKTQKTATPIIHWLKYISYEAGFLSRGYVVAAYKACSPYWKRLALGLVD